MVGMGRLAIGSAIGAALGALAVPFLRPLFSVPTGGVGAITVMGYPKGWDYAVIALLVLGAAVGGAWPVARSQSPAAPTRSPATVNWQLTTALIVFLTMLFLHDHPYAPMDPFHEGEHLTAGWRMKSGERPYGDFFIFHGLAADAGLDALVLGDPPSPLRPRRLQTVLDAATLALLVPIAAELTATAAGMIAGVVVSLCAAAALWLPVFPYYRLAPVLLAVLFVLRGRLFLAFASATLGVLWSLDTGLFAVAGVAAGVLILRVPIRKALLFGAIALVLPLVVLFAVRADIRQFAIDSFVIMPKAIDPVWSLPAPKPLTANGVRYYLPPVFYGFFLALAFVAWRRGDKRLAAQIAIVAVFSILLFRTAAGRVSWSHTRFAVPLLGIAMVAFVLEPLLLRKQRLAAVLLAIPLFFYFEVRENFVSGAKLLAGWPARQHPQPLTNPADLAALASVVDSLGPKDATILDFSNERALYFLLRRKPAVRVMEISMLSVPRLLSEAMAQLNANPPLCVIVQGDPNIAAFDGVSSRDRVPDLAAWIDANYPRRIQAGRFVVAAR